MTPVELPPAPWNEQERLKALRSYDILDTPKESDFEDIARMAAHICNVPISVINFVDSDRQWFKAEMGLGLRETPRDISICTHAILQKGLFTVPDTTKDPRFVNNPFVENEPHLRFYAGALLETPEGLPIGTMCVLDYKPRVLTEHESFVLNALARQVMTQLELRRALKEKRQSEERLTLALEASGSIGTWDWDVVNNRVYADPRFVAIFGGDPSWSTAGVPVEDYIHAVHPEDVTQIQTAIASALKTGAFFRDEYRILQKDGSVRWIDARGRCQLDAEGRPVRFPGVAVDITERKAGEERERQAAARFRFLAESMPQKIFTATPRGEVDFFNQQWMEFSGLPFEEVRGNGWTCFIHPDDLEENLRRWRAALEHATLFEMEHRFRRHDGVYRWHLSRAHPMRNSAGEVSMWIGSNTDIDDQRRAKELLEHTVAERTGRLRESVAELEAFSYSISHDMRAPLRAMSGFAEVLKEDYSDKLDEDGRRYLDRIVNASARMDDLIRDVLSFSRVSRSEIHLERVDLNVLFREIIESYPNLSSSQADIVLPDSLPTIKANSAILTQCVSNLLGNAVKFVAKGIKPRVIVQNTMENGRVRLSFTDNGIGIPEHEQAKIFEIFHRGDRAYEGTGIGLAIVKKAAERMNGSVGLTSKPGAGSTFWLDFDAA